MSAQSSRLLPVLALLTTVSHSALAATNPYANSPQNVLNGDSAIVASANYGRGIVFGDIDTGIVNNLWFTSAYNGQGINNIDTVNSGVCLNGTCHAVNPVTSPTDGNSHGTFTASQMVGGVPGSGYEGMAPAGTVLSVQVLNAQGSGTSTDVANGIVWAVNHGANVLNLSLGPGGTAAQNAAFYQSLAAAVNYAASKNVYVVFAGGNSATTLTGTTKVTGFTDAAISHMLFMGSTNASKTLSSFSNTPGAAGFTSTTGKFTAYDTMWLMADGENILGASNYHTAQYGYGYVQTDSGTSMAAPQGTAALGLLEAKWPVLVKNGDAALVLEATGTDLGSKGIDTNYGDGFLNLNQAFQPVGSLYVTTKAGANVTVTSLTGAMLSGGALGTLSSITSLLKNYTAFDTFQRNFTVDLSGLVSTKPSTSSVSSSFATTVKSLVTGTRFADGSSLQLGNAQADTITPAIGQSNASSFFVSFTDASGTTMAAGNGFPASASFADALWGSGSTVSSEVSALGVSTALTSYAEGGEFAAYGARIDKDTRLAFSWTQTQSNDFTAGSNVQNGANAFNAGITQTLAEGWQAGVTFGMLSQQGGLLGTSYGNNGLISLGEQNRSMSMGVSSAFALGGKCDLLLDAAIARTGGSGLTQGIVSSVTPLYARSFGAALVQNDAVKQGDNLSLSLRSPLRVYSGSASVSMTSVDGEGNPITTSQKVSLRPDGNEVDLTLGYQAPVENNMSWNAAIEGRRDPDNIAGTSDVAVVIGGKLTF